MTASKVDVPETIHLIGIPLPFKTTNENGQSNVDIGNHWQAFEKGQYFTKIPNIQTQEVYAVYHEYEGDHMAPFSYFIGCRVSPGTEVPEGLGLHALSIPPGAYHQLIAKGQMPHCIGQAWQEVWQSGVERAFQMDYEVYGEKSQNWNNAEVDIFIS
ncbi:MAG: effector binding domain-containing protein [Bacteroidota bacterium]